MRVLLSSFFHSLSIQIGSFRNHATIETAFIHLTKSPINTRYCGLRVPNKTRPRRNWQKLRPVWEVLTGVQKGGSTVNWHSKKKDESRETGDRSRKHKNLLNEP